MSQESLDLLFYGDNLDILRDNIASNSIDLIYLDPPFNSNANYNILFSSPSGESSAAQIEAFGDTWHWNYSSEQAFDEVMRSNNSDVSELLRSMRNFLKENDMMAYISMMAIRLIELHRVLKKTGSIYLHCDPTASHYLKLLMDAVFGPRMFRNEIIWKRTNSHNVKTKQLPKYHDTLLFYSKSKNFTFNVQYQPYSEAQLNRYKRDRDGRLYKAENLTMISSTEARNFVWRGSRPPKNRGWGLSLEKLEELWAEGRILVKSDGTPRLDGLKVFFDDMKGKVIGSIWDDIARIGNTSGERLHYPTQKPMALLERIVDISSNPGDIILDPFCGCGTAVHAAQKLNRRWIGIDITHLAVNLIRRRLIDAFPRACFEVRGVPQDLGGATELAKADKHQFELWALSLVEAQPYKGGRKGADGGVDGYIYFRADGRTVEKAVVSVKGGLNVGVVMIRDLIATIERENAKVGIFLTLSDPTTRMKTEATSAGFYNSPLHGKFERIQILTIEEILQGKQPHLPWIDASVFKKTRREIDQTQNELDL